MDEAIIGEICDFTNCCWDLTRIWRGSACARDAAKLRRETACGPLSRASREA